ncbi:stalk domain-containing protein [Paenibacillaceae bacterium WGS1546]|uniref:stalk domain-containing protein n=1 Tax=Cohnella sp. WGS1546 TaxID=3366810 RepID=UPI00372D74F7
MRKSIKAAAIVALGLALVAPSAAVAAADTGWTKSAKLYEIRTWAGQSQWGHENGSLDAATLFHPSSIVELPDGRLLVADTENHLLRVVSTDRVSAYGGLIVGESEPNVLIGAYHDDALDLAAFHLPAGLATDAQGNIYVADSGNHAVRKISSDGKVSTLAGNGLIGSDDAKGKKATFHSPSDVAVDSKGNVYVADTLNHVIRKITPDGTVSTLTAPSERVIEFAPNEAEEVGDYADGPIARAKFNEPSALVVDQKGNLYVSDRGNHRIRYIDFAAGTVSTVAGGSPNGNGSSVYGNNEPYAEGGYADGAVARAKFNAPEGLSLTADGELIVADSLNHAIRIIRDGQVSTLTGVPEESGSADGVTGSAQFNRPSDVVILSDGRLAIADKAGHKIRVLQKYAKPATAPSGSTIAVLLNGQAVTLDVPPLARSNAVMLPVRSLGNALGYEVDYDAESGTATLTKGNVQYAVASGAKTVTKTVDGKKQSVSLNAPALHSQNRMYLPVRFFAEESGLDVQWDASARTVVIRDPVF